jgi:hypothetical protein
MICFYTNEYTQFTVIILFYEIKMKKKTEASNVYTLNILDSRI